MIFLIIDLFDKIFDWLWYLIDYIGSIYLLIVDNMGFWIEFREMFNWNS